MHNIMLTPIVYTYLSYEAVYVLGIYMIFHVILTIGVWSNSLPASSAMDGAYSPVPFINTCE